MFFFLFFSPLSVFTAVRQQQAISLLCSCVAYFCAKLLAHFDFMQSKSFYKWDRGGGSLIKCEEPNLYINVDILVCKSYLISFPFPKQCFES